MRQRGFVKHFIVTLNFVLISSIEFYGVLLQAVSGVGHCFGWRIVLEEVIQCFTLHFLGNDQLLLTIIPILTCMNKRLPINV